MLKSFNCGKSTSAIIGEIPFPIIKKELLHTVCSTLKHSIMQKFRGVAIEEFVVSVFLLRK